MHNRLKGSVANFIFTHAGHVDMVRFLLERGADQEHKTDEMHTALMEASMVRSPLYNQYLIICYEILV